MIQLHAADIAKLRSANRKSLQDRGAASNERMKRYENGDIILVKIVNHTEGETSFGDLVGTNYAYGKLCNVSGGIIDDDPIKVKGFGLQDGTVPVDGLILCLRWDGDWLACIPEVCPS